MLYRFIKKRSDAPVEYEILSLEGCYNRCSAPNGEQEWWHQKIYTEVVREVKQQLEQQDGSKLILVSYNNPPISAKRAYITNFIQILLDGEDTRMPKEYPIPQRTN